MNEQLPPGVGAEDQIILFDGVCKLCNRWSRFIIDTDKAQVFKLCSVQSTEGQAILAWFGYPTDYYETMLLIQGKKALEKSDAFIAVMQRLAYPWRIIALTKIIPRIIRNWLYDRIALNRYKISGKYDYCVMPSPDHDRRFLSS